MVKPINSDGSGRLTSQELKAIGETPLRKTSDKASNIFARCFNAFKQWRQAEADIYAFEHGDYQRMLDYYCNLPKDSANRKLFQSRMEKLADTLALDNTHSKTGSYLEQLEGVGIYPNGERAYSNEHLSTEQTAEIPASIAKLEERLKTIESKIIEKTRELINSMPENTKIDEYTKTTYTKDEKLSFSKQTEISKDVLRLMNERTKIAGRIQQNKNIASQTGIELPASPKKDSTYSKAMVEFQSYLNHHQDNDSNWMNNSQNKKQRDAIEDLISILEEIREIAQ